MLFCYGYRNKLPTRRNQTTKLKKLDIKKEHKSTWNSSRHTVDFNYKIGDQNLLLNYKKKSKLNPYYLLKKFKKFKKVLAKGYILPVKSLNTDKCLMRHPNDVKIFVGHAMITMKSQYCYRQLR